MHSLHHPCLFVSVNEYLNHLSQPTPELPILTAERAAGETSPAMGDREATDCPSLVSVYRRTNCSQGQAAASVGGCTLGIAMVGSGLRKASFTLG